MVAKEAKEITFSHHPPMAINLTTEQAETHLSSYSPEGENFIKGTTDRISNPQLDKSSTPDE